MTAVCACVPQELYSMRSGAVVVGRDEEDDSRAGHVAAHAAHAAAAAAGQQAAAEEDDDEKDPILAAAAAAFFGAISAVDGPQQQQQQQQQQAPPPPPPPPPQPVVVPLPPNPFASAAAHMTYLPMHQHMPSSSAVPMMFSAVPMQPMQPMAMTMAPPPPPPPPMAPPMAPAPSFGPASLQLNPAFLERMRSSMMYASSAAPGGISAPAPLRLHQSVTTAGPSAAAAVAPAMPAPHAFSAPQPSYRPHPLFAATTSNEQQQYHHQPQQQGSPLKRGREEPGPRRSSGGGGSGGSIVPPSAAPQQQQQQHQQPTPKPLPPQLLRHTRRISCRTYLKRLNVTQFMSDHLLPLAPGSAREPGATRLPRSYELLFKEVVTLILEKDEQSHETDADADDARAAQRRRTSEDNGPSPPSPSARPRRQTRDLAPGSTSQRLSCFPVTYEGVLCASQRHLRLTCGWSEFARASGLRVGDAVTFERRGEDRSVLHVSIVRGGIVPAAGAVAFADVAAAPPASRRGRGGGGARRSGSGSGSGSDAGGCGGGTDGGAAAGAPVATAAAAPGAPVAGTAPVLMQRWGSGTFLI